MTVLISVKLPDAEQQDVSVRPEVGSFQEFYTSHRTMVWRSLLRLGVPEASIEDAVQDVFIAAHRRLESFEGRSKITTWLYGIAIRVAKDHRRTQMRMDRRLDRVREAQALDTSGPPGPADALARREANALLHRLLSRLPEAQREVFVLVDLEGQTVLDASVSLNLGLRSCQRHLKVARAAVESALSEPTSEKGEPCDE